MEPRDEETGDERAEAQPFRPYHDDSDGSDSPGPDAPLNPQRPPTELEYHRQAKATWQSSIGDRVPPHARKAWAATVAWVKGPDPPFIYTIRSLFPKVQHIPISLLDRYAPRKLHRFGLLLLVYFAWLLAFSLVLWRSSFAATIPGHGTPVRLSCSMRYWRDANGCGLNGDECRPFSNATLAFRCPAECHKIQMLNPHAVGDEEVVYKPLVVGGPMEHDTGFEDRLENNAIYRSDSFICASAVHAGFISDLTGGCGVLTLTGEQTDFASSKRHDIPSTAFPSYFPQTFGFLKGTQAQCRDLRWPSTIVTAVFSALLSLFTTSPGVFFWSIFIALFFNTALASDPPNLTNYHDLVSIAFGRFLPACFCAAITYQYTVKRSLTNLTAQIEKTILWLGPAWVGALNNYTFDRIPIQRLTPHDLQTQPGAIPALITVVLSIFFIALGQAWSFRLEGRMPRYLAIYGIFVATLLLLLAVPGQSLRIHHYILALLLLPGTSFQNRRSLVYQGLLVGLFINGIARWGFDSILQTPGDLARGQQQGTLLPAVSVLGIGASNITFDLGRLPVYSQKSDTSFDGMSVLVNDVERLRGYGDEWSYGESDEGNLTWTWNRHQVRGLGQEPETDTAKKQYPEYFRFGYMSGSATADYTKAGVWEANGGWADGKAGASSVDFGDVGEAGFV